MVSIQLYASLFSTRYPTDDRNGARHNQSASKNCNRSLLEEARGDAASTDEPVPISKYHSERYSFV